LRRSLFLSPGRGLRGAKLAEIQRKDDEALWAVAAEVQTAQEAVRLGTGLDPERISDKEKRIVRVNGRTAKGQHLLADYLSIVWLTPQMDRLFLESSRERRRFLDRLVFGFDPGHSGRVVRYENAVAQRSRLLREGRGDPSWLSALEQLIAETGTAIAAARLDFVNRLQSACGDSRHAPFPLVRLSIAGFLEEVLLTHKALEAEALFRERMLESRERDSVSGGMRSGPHKSDMNVVYFEKDMPAAQCSTGEQKALLTGIVLAHARGDCSGARRASPSSVG
jgi:DNA replication and repair protein RecF